jgi:hypothetical protein
MPIYKGKTSINILLPFNNSSAILQSINITSKFKEANFISLYVRDANGTDISISADPMKLKQGEAYIRDSILKLDAGHQFYITVTGPIDYYIVTTP